MSKLLARIMLAIFMLPLGTLVYVAVVAASFSIRPFARRDAFIAFLTADISAGVFVGIYWWLLWRTAVKWTSQRIAWTVLAVVVWGLVALPIAVPFERYVGDGFGVFLGGVTTILGWLVTSVFIWRETAFERIERLDSLGIGAVTCPTCGVVAADAPSTLATE